MHYPTDIRNAVRQFSAKCSTDLTAIKAALAGA